MTCYRDRLYKHVIIVVEADIKRKMFLCDIPLYNKNKQLVVKLGYVKIKARQIPATANSIECKLKVIC